MTKKLTAICSLVASLGGCFYEPDPELFSWHYEDPYQPKDRISDTRIHRMCTSVDDGSGFLEVEFGSEIHFVSRSWIPRGAKPEDYVKSKEYDDRCRSLKLEY